MEVSILVWIMAIQLTHRIIIPFSKGHDISSSVGFDDSMRLVGWTNIETGEVKSPYPDLNPKDYKMYRLMRHQEGFMG